VGRATEIVPAGRTKASCPLRDRRRGQIRRVDRAPHTQAIEVAVRHVAERDAVHRLTDLLGLEAAHRDAIGPLVHAEAIDRLHVHTRKALDHLERARSRRGRFERRAIDRGGGARTAAAGHTGDLDRGELLGGIALGRLLSHERQRHQGQRHERRQREGRESRKTTRIGHECSVRGEIEVP
jgi:hypothetical protein